MWALTLADTGKTVETKSGDFLEVTLDVSSTAGFTWKLVGMDSSVLKKIGVQTIIPMTKTIGSGNKMIFTFQAQNAGEGKLKLHYLRPRENRGPSKIFEITVKVV